MNDPPDNEEAPKRPESKKRRLSRAWEGEVSSVEKVWVEGEDEVEVDEGRLPLDELTEPDTTVRDEIGHEIPAPGEALSQPLIPASDHSEGEAPPSSSPPSSSSPSSSSPRSSSPRSSPPRSSPPRSPSMREPSTAEETGEPPEPATPERPSLHDDGVEPDGSWSDEDLFGASDTGLYVEDLKSGPADVDEFTQEDYLAGSTQEYRDFAEELAKASTEEVEQQAVAASIPGVGSGLIGFDDVTGQRSVTEEDVEHQEQQAASDLTVRVGTGLVLVGIFLGGLMLGRPWFTAVVCGVIVLSLGEFYATVRTRGYVPVALFGFLGALGAAIGTHRGGVQAIGTAVVLTLAVTGLMYGITVRRNPLENAAITMLGMAWVSMLAFAVAIARAENFVGLILLVVLLTAFYDIGAYFVGRTVGRRQLAPVVSPGKTVEGFVGGFVTVMLLAAIFSTFPTIFGLNLVESLLLAAVIAVLAPLGDAAESVIKRALDVKDMGSLLPGHGGMLDRIDALLFVVPGAYLLLTLLDKL